MKPITIIIPAYNRGDDLRGALTSLEAQIAHNFQVIVSDDCSDKEDLSVICKEPQFTYDITYIRTPTNFGCGGNREFALRYFYEHPSTYLMFMDSDDRLAPQATARLFVAIEQDEADIVASNIVAETPHSNQLVKSKEDAKTWLHGKIYRTKFLMDNDIHFAYDLRSNEDLAFNLTCDIFKHTTYYLEEELYFWRQLESSVTHISNSMLACDSSDYIDAIWAVFNIAQQHNNVYLRLARHILNCYVYWQRALIYKTIRPEIAAKMSCMLHHPEVEKLISNLAEYEEYMEFKQFCVKEKSLIFFPQTFGQWLLKFFTPQELQTIALKYGQETEKES